VTVIKTALGAQVMKDRSVALTPPQRSALILCDGKRSVEEVMKMTAAVGVGAADIQMLFDLGLIERASAAAAPGASVATSASASAPASMPAPISAPVPISAAPANNVDFREALDAAITLCSSLGFKGFGLNMALTSVDSIEKLQKLAPEIRKAAGDAKYKPLHALIFGAQI
jgi:hypothetical protein